MRTNFVFRHFPNVSFFVKLKLLLDNRYISPKYIPKALEGLLNGLALFPVEVYETLKYKKAIRLTKIDKDPIFIIGFWRSGTTHLHNLMVLDPQFAFASLFNVTYPRSFIVNSWLKDKLEKFLPETRPMDNVKLSFSAPQEEEFAICNISPYSYYHSFQYPRNGDDYHKKYVLFEDVDTKVIRKWQSSYKYILKKLTYVNNGKQLVLKNPANIGRVKMILEMYPNAKFVHIYRNPYEVYLSCLNLYDKITRGPRLHNLQSSTELENNVIYRYTTAMKKYFDEYKLIPKGSLVEIRYEDLLKSPIENIENIYDKLELSGIDDVKKNLSNYLKDIKDYKCNKYNLTDNVIETIKENFGFILEKWGYDIPVG